MVSGAGREGRILVIGPGHVGDLLRITPVLEVVRRNRPDAFLCVLTRSRSAGLLVGNAAVDRVITYDRRSSKWYVPDHLLLAHRLRRLRFGTALNYSKNRLLGRIVMGIGIPEVRMAEMTFRKNRVLHNLDSVNEFGFPGRCDRLVLGVSPAARERVRRLLSEAGHREGTRLIGIHVGTRADARGSSHPLEKAWPPGRIVDLVDRLAESMEASAVLTGAGREREISAEIGNRARVRPLDLTGRTDLEELAALMQLCDAFVSPDTGPMHIAASQQTRLVALFGPTSPEVDSPYMAGDRLALIKKDTMASIDAEEVLAALTRLLED